MTALQELLISGVPLMVVAAGVVIGFYGGHVRDRRDPARDVVVSHVTDQYRNV